MKKNLLAILGLVFICIIISILLYYPHYKQEQDLHKKRERLANVMGVSLETYPNLPDDYFSDILKPGMSLDEIHTIVVGYEKVFHNSRKQETYYYFSTNDDDADRILIWYNQEYKVRVIIQEDENSRTLTVIGWMEGLLVK